MEETTTEGPKRPQFLTVLCILSYVGVGLWIVMYIIGWWSMRAMAAMMDGTAGMIEGMEDMESLPGMEEAMAQMKYLDINTIAGIAGCLICLVGALQMWKLKKIGFYIYVVGEVAPFAVSAVLMGSAAFSGMAILGAIIPVVFVVLYALNLKHLS